LKAARKKQLERFSDRTQLCGHCGFASTYHWKNITAVETRTITEIKGLCLQKSLRFHGSNHPELLEVRRTISWNQLEKLPTNMKRSLFYSFVKISSFARSTTEMTPGHFGHGCNPIEMM